MDATGKPVIPAQFQLAREFRGDRAAVQVEGHWGFLDPTGEMVVPAVFKEVGDFADGLAPFKREGRWGFIDLSGAVVIPPHYASVMGFSDGLSAVEEGDRWGYIDRYGHWAIEPRFTEVPGRFNNDRAPVALGNHNRDDIVYIDRTGRTAIPGPYSFGEVFNNDRAVALQHKGGARSSTLLVIDRSGRELLRVDDWRGGHPNASLGVFFGSIVFSEGLCALPFKGLWGFVDREGKTAIPPSFVLAEPFSEGLAAVAVMRETAKGNHGLYGYIDRAGNWRVPPRYELAGPFHQGVARVTEISGHSFYIDSTGRNLVGPFQWKDAGDGVTIQSR